MDWAPQKTQKPGVSKVFSRPIPGQVLRELVAHEVAHTPGPRHAFFNRRVRFGGYFHLRILAYPLASWASILLAHVVQALKAPRNVFDLPALIRSDLLALHATAGARSLLRTQFVNLGCDRKLFEVG